MKGHASNMCKITYFIIFSMSAIQAIPETMSYNEFVCGYRTSYGNDDLPAQKV